MNWTVYISDVAREGLDEAHSYYEAKQSGLGTEFWFNYENRGASSICRQ